MFLFSNIELQYQNNLKGVFHNLIQEPQVSEYHIF